MYRCALALPLCAIVAAAPLINGCSTPVLIRPDDATFREQQGRLVRTHALVESLPAGKAEAPLFLQAESFYRYRFEPPARSFGNYVAVALAVATEFAPLQALAASAGMFELRLRSYDGAVQLWETMLAMHPETALAPLTLYRLGWAYRSVGTGGFPRDEPDEAFAELLKRFPHSPYAPLASEARQVAWKSQDWAIGLSIIPGGGQAYAGEYGNAAVRFVIAAAFAAMAIVPVVVLYDRWQEDRFFESENLAWAGTAVLGIVLLNVAYTAAYQDAQRAVVQFNERQERAFEAKHPEAP